MRRSSPTLAEDLQVEVSWRAAKARTLTHRGRPDEAVRLAREAVRLSEPTDELSGRAGALLALGDALASLGRGGEAAEAFEAAIALYERKENLAGAARARAVRESEISPSRG